MKAIAPKLRFDWCTDFQSYQAPYPSGEGWTSAYPGDDVVDVISMDVYDEWNSGWTDIVNPPNGVGLEAFRTFAQQHGKPEAYPEWSCSTAPNGNGDDPLFVSNMYTWMGAGNVLYQSYWNTYLGGPNAMIQGPNSGLVPLSAAKYKGLFSL